MPLSVRGPGDAWAGHVRYSPLKSLWFSAMFGCWVIGGTLYFSWAAVAVFLAVTGITLCLGHSIGMHRKVIHDSYNCQPWFEALGVWLGTLVGLGGPKTMIYTHDIRDWAQRQEQCHPFLCHQSSMLKDAWWQLHCKLHLDNPPSVSFPEKTARRSYRFLQSTSMAQQILFAAPLYWAGGLGFVFWGVCGRVSVSIVGHWLIGYFAHNHGQRHWHISGAAIQGYNVRFCGLITFGECWHNNHHAFPGSARLGLEPGQFDPGWLVLKVAQSLGIVWNLKEPHHLAARPELLQLSSISETLAPTAVRLP